MRLGAAQSELSRRAVRALCSSAARDGRVLAHGSERTTTLHTHSADAYECDVDEGWSGVRSDGTRTDARARSPASAEPASAPALTRAVRALLKKSKQTRLELARRAGGVSKGESAAKWFAGEVEAGFVPWLRARAPDGFMQELAELESAGDSAGVHALLSGPLGDYADELGGARDELRERAVDMTEPHEWYPQARAIRRRIVMHVGPTNSGKTHAAMQALKRARSGVYCGPLRLLAWEVHDRLNEEGVACDLVTGQERVEHDGARHVACTVEMTSTSAWREVAVIDEIQMLANEQRGWAWTRALLGVCADEVHLCGDDSAVQLVHRIAERTGDDVAVQRYTRLSPLAVATERVQSVDHLRPGDALIAFSRSQIYQLRRRIEKRTAHKTCVVYGALPPETRKAQAAIFNGDGGAVLVASDAIGMGLNLNIGRVVFSQVEKFDGVQMRRLLPTEVKQIGGRAGRFGSEFPSGVVSCLSSNADLAFVRDALGAELPPVDACGLMPTDEQLEQFSRVSGQKTFSRLLRAYFRSLHTDGGLYFVTPVDDMLRVAKLLDWVPIESVGERLTFCLAPIDVGNDRQAAALYWFAMDFAAYAERRQPVRLRVKPPSAVPRTPNEIRELESAHATLDAYLWLAQRLPREFGHVSQAAAMREHVGELITAYLDPTFEGSGLEYPEAPGRHRAKRAERRQRQQAARAHPPPAHASPKPKPLGERSAADPESIGGVDEKTRLKRQKRRVAKQMLRGRASGHGVEAPAMGSM